MRKTTFGIARVRFQLDRAGHRCGRNCTCHLHVGVDNDGERGNGLHMLTARALDTAGNTTLSAGIPVTVTRRDWRNTRTLGHSSVGAGVDTGAAQHINAWRFTMPNESGIATSLAVYIASPIGAAPNNQFQVAVYADQNGAPGTLIAAS